MWSDNETEQDLLDFSGVAGAVAENPISNGVSVVAKSGATLLNFS
jgi:hypothetical protein